MIKNDNILDELFRSKLDDFEQVPPSYVWMKIQEKQKAGKKKRKLHAIRIGGIAAAVLLAFLLGWQLQEHRLQLTERPVVAEQEQPENPAPVQAQQEKAEPARHVTEKPVIMNENSSSLVYSSKKENRMAHADPGQKAQKAAEMPAFVQSLNLLTMADAKIETPEFITELKSKGSNNRENKTELTEKDLFMIEMNKQFQEKNTDMKDHKSWSVGALVSPVYSVNKSSYDASYASNMSRPGEKDHINIGGGISVEYQTGKRWSIQSGLHYSRVDQSSGASGNSQSMIMNDQLGYTFFNNKVQMESSGKLLMNASAGVIEIEKLPASVRVSSSLESTEGSNELLLTSDDFEQRFEYIEIPLLVRYRLIDRTWNMHLLGGFSANMLVGNNVYMKNESGDFHIGKTKDMKSLNYSASFGFGLGYHLTDKIQLHIEPQLKYYLRSLSNNPDVTFEPYSIGIYTGVSYRF